MTRTSDDRLKNDLRKRSRTRRDRLSEAARVESARVLKANDLLPEVTLEWREIASLKFSDRRLRKSDAAHIGRVKNAIESFGFCAPVQITHAGEVLDGHIRLEAARRLGLAKAPCLITGHLPAPQQRLFAISLNRLAERGTWDLEVLRTEMVELSTFEMPLEITGFELEEIDQIILNEGHELVEEEEVESAPDGPPLCKPGDLWRLGSHLVVCGDARDPSIYRRLFNTGAAAQLVLTDPPYNVPVQGHVTRGDHREFAMAAGEMTAAEFAEFNCAWMTAALEHLVDGGLLAPFIDWRSVAPMIQAGESLNLSLLNLVVWAKSNAGMGSLWRSQHELLPVLKKGSASHRNNVQLGRHGRWRSNVWNYPGASSLGSDARKGLKDHPTTKPTAMLEDALLDITNRDDLVLDPFLGSGSTLVAADASGRICRGIELDPLYVDVAIRRWIAKTAGEPELVERIEATGP